MQTTITNIKKCKKTFGDEKNNSLMTEKQQKNWVYQLVQADTTRHTSHHHTTTQYIHMHENGHEGLWWVLVFSKAMHENKHISKKTKKHSLETISFNETHAIH